ncbi:putative DNA polymerase beta domain protein region [Syntrophobacter sp. SbD1]|nr:putative DNA polymerase beta domain protein region [Syntrophobacter sp. SbD1]
MVIRSIAIKVPNYSKAYVFGSTLTSSDPNDFDLLIVYDEDQCLPYDAFAKHAGLVQEIKMAYGLPVHLTLLTTSEAKSVDIFNRTNAVPLLQWLEKEKLHSSTDT